MKIKIFLMLILSSVFISCENLFELERDRSDLPEWQTVTDLTGMLTGSYKTLLNNGGWSSPMSSLTIHTENAHDLGYMHPGGSLSYASPIETRSDYPFVAMSTFNDTYTRCYISISCTNTLIAFIQEVEDGNVPIMSGLSDSDQAELTRIKGEAHFMRAYAYYALSLAFMPPYSTENSDRTYIPYITERYYTAEELLSPPMGTMQEVYDLIMSDLQIAKDELESLNQSDVVIQSTNRGYANVYAASAMLMRMYFIQQNWSAALAECNYIIDNGPFDLNEQPIRAFNRNYVSSNPVSSEVIFECSVTGEVATQNTHPNLGRWTKIGSWKSAVNTTYDLSDENWLMGGRGDNWLHTDGAAMCWNPTVLKDIGWVTFDDDDSDLLFQLTPEAEADLRCTQLAYYLKPYEEGGNEQECEMTYITTTWSTLWGDKYLRAPIAQYTEWPLIRFAEVLLTKASCLVQSGGSNSDALSALNVVRHRAFGGDTSYYLSGTVTEDVVEQERIKELAFEIGDRMLYLAAMRRDIPSNGKKTTPTEEGSVVPVLAHPYNDFHHSLPDEEIDYSSTAWQATDYYNE